MIDSKILQGWIKEALKENVDPMTVEEITKELNIRFKKEIWTELMKMDEIDTAETSSAMFYIKGD